MRKFLFLYAVLLSYTAGAQKLDIGFNYNADIPFRQTMPMMSMNHGAGMYIALRPLKNSNSFWISSDISTGAFAYKSRMETYTFSDGSTTDTWVNYSSNLHKFLFGANYDIGKRDDLISGYLTAQAGYAIMNAKIYIEDPNDPGGCKALENKNTFSYGSGIAAAGGGVRININKLSKKKENTSKLFNHYIDIGVKYMAGGTFQYVNIKHMQDHTHGIASAQNTSPSRDTKDLTVQFVNVTTNNIHEHKVAEIYSSGFEMLNLKIGYLITF